MTHLARPPPVQDSLDDSGQDPSDEDPDQTVKPLTPTGAEDAKHILETANPSGDQGRSAVALLLGA